MDMANILQCTVVLSVWIKTVMENKLQCTVVCEGMDNRYGKYITVHCGL